MKRKLVAVSDMHGTLPDIQECDLLLIAGDICPVSNHAPTFQAEWLASTFRYWLKAQPAQTKVFVAGNHDFVFEQMPELIPRDLPALYLQDSWTMWQGLKIWGTPWQPWFFDWAFNLYEPDLKKKWDLIPDDTDILVVHGPPFNYGDGVPERGGVRRTGSPALLERIKVIQPQLVVFGHIHEGRGEWQIGATRLANVTILDAKYNHVYEPWTCEVEVPEGHDSI